jgi:hypothetical protein
MVNKCLISQLYNCITGALLLLTGGCQQSPIGEKPNTPEELFRLLPSSKTHIDFVNKLTEGMNTNVLMYEYFYNGGGVATGDLNGDGLQDIYFTGNMSDNKVYLNKGHMIFTDITAVSGATGRSGPWKTGVSFADVDGDGKLDIYVCYSGKVSAKKRVNQLFINQGNDVNGVPRFKDMAREFGLSFPSFSTQAYFFDYDRDGDLDLLLVNHNCQRISSLDDISVRSLMEKNDTESGIRLLENTNRHFIDVTKRAGIINTPLSYGLAAGIADINGDGWPDVYISNDYNVPDRLYINSGKKGFSDQLQRQIGHTSFYSMGNDVADINNDGKPDIFTLDMLPEDNKRQKLLFGADNYESFDLNVRVGFHYQYMRNMLHLNNGNDSFSEIGQLAGVSNTDWSWSPLFADFDNDGWKDLFVSNGYTRDYTNMDFLKFMGDNLRDRKVMRQDLLNIVSQMPSSKVKSYFFKNRGNATFQNVSKEWGITQSSNSNGAAYADLDNDGDMDIVVNNVNDTAFVYENRARQLYNNHYLSVRLNGMNANTQGIGAKLTVYIDGKIQCLEQMPAKGFQSSVSAVLHFGLGKAKRADSLRIVWQQGKTQLLSNLKADKTLILDEKNAISSQSRPQLKISIYQQATVPIPFKITKNTINDFKRQPLMVNPISFSGSIIVKGDVNGDRLDDIYVGGHDGQTARLYLQQKNGQFILKANNPFEKSKNCTDVAAAFLDANGDGKQDLYVCSGGYADYGDVDKLLQDRLYLGDGTGKFRLSPDALPALISSKSCVKVADINGDGYPDIFVGGRVIPGRYPEAPESYILINDGKGHFSDKTLVYNRNLKKIGMVTDAEWADMNGDGKPDLIVVGEWMPITVFENTGANLVDATNKYFDKKYSGWWNCVQVRDINKDGHPDIIAGNLGANSQCRVSDSEPAEMFYKDFDDNGSVDPILCFFIQHHSYPFVSRDELLDQMSMMRTRFPDYKSYADATINQVFNAQELRGAGHLTANYLNTACFVSNKGRKLHPVNLPLQAQLAPVYTITSFDYDHDGAEDLLLCGNMNHARIRFGKYDANFGVLLRGDGKGHYQYISQQQSGFKITGDVRSVNQVNDILLFGLDNGKLEAYKKTSP